MAGTTEREVLEFNERYEKLTRGTIQKGLQKSMAKFWNAVDMYGFADASRMFNRLIKWGPIEDSLRKTIGLTSKVAARKMDRNLKADFDVWFDPILLNYLDDIMFEKVTGIMTSTRDIIARFEIAYINQLAEGSINPDTLARQIRKDWDNLTRMRALRIARTEVGSAANFGRLQAAEQSEVVDTKTWNAVFKNTRDQHQQMHGTTVGKGETFTMPNGDVMSHPSDFNGSAENVVNCQCYLTFD